MGSIVPVIGTGIGGAVGAVGGGLIGLFAGANADDDNPEEQNFDDQAAEIERQKSRAQKDAYQNFMLGEASRMGANPTLVASSRYQNQLGDIDSASGASLQALQNQQSQYQDQQDEVDPRSLLQLAGAASSVGQGLYKQYGTNNVQTPVDIGTSPEVSVAPDPENLSPLRKGKLMGFNGSTY